MDRLTDVQTDKAKFKVACPRLKMNVNLQQTCFLKKTLPFESIPLLNCSTTFFFVDLTLQTLFQTM